MSHGLGRLWTEDTTPSLWFRRFLHFGSLLSGFLFCGFFLVSENIPPVPLSSVLVFIALFSFTGLVQPMCIIDQNCLYNPISWSPGFTTYQKKSGN